MSTLTLLLPARTQVRASPQLARWTTRGDRLADAKPGREAQLRECFEFPGSTLPVAALTRDFDAGDAAGAQWLRADPCHVKADTIAVRMLACGDLGLAADEAEELARALRPLFGDAGFPLETATPQRWYLRCPVDVRLPAFADPAQVLGDDMMQHLPRGENERQWRHLLNEAQVILHNHPLNLRRVQNGRMPANSLWFWGAGTLPNWMRTRFTRIVGTDVVVTALARQVKVPVVDAVGAFADRHEDDAVLVDCRDGVVPPVGAVDQLDLSFSSGERYRYKPWHRWRWWRRLRE
jgi:hypothetical protein